MLLCLDLVALVRRLQFADLDKLRSKGILIHRTTHPVLKDSLPYDLNTLAYADGDQQEIEYNSATRELWSVGLGRSATGARNAALVIAAGTWEKLPRGRVSATPNSRPDSPTPLISRYLKMCNASFNSCHYSIEPCSE
jgi:hypothetical protein